MVILIARRRDETGILHLRRRVQTSFEQVGVVGGKDIVMSTASEAHFEDLPPTKAVRFDLAAAALAVVAAQGHASDPDSNKRLEVQPRRPT